MKRNFLEELGLEKDVIDKIMSENGQDIEKAKGSLADVQKERDELKTTVADRDKQLEDLKKTAKGNEDLQKQIEELQAANKSIKFDSAVEKALTGAKAKNVKALKALLNLEGAELNTDGSVKGLDEQLKALQKSDAYLFDSEEKVQKTTVVKGVTPADPGDNKPKGITQEQFNRMSYKDKLNLYNTDKDTYDALSGVTTQE